MSAELLARLESTLGRVPRGPVIGGRTHEGGQGVAVLDPASEQVVAEIGGAGVAEAMLAVDAAHAAAENWSATPPRTRAEVLRRAFDLMTARAGALAQLIVVENGKSLRDARAEVTYAAEFLRWYSEEAVRMTGSIDTAPGGTHRVLVTHRPVGVCLLITPWNFPAAMATRKIAPALAAGCTVVLKPALETPLTALVISTILREAGLPDGVVNVVPAIDADAVSSTLLDDPRVRKISFTGSTAVGRRLLGHAARTVVSSSMELGGNAPFLVLEGAGVDEAIDGAMTAKMRNGGSACTAANRFYVHESIVDDFTAGLGRAMSDLSVGPGLDPENDIGPLVDARQRTRVADLVAAELDGGACAAVGGNVPDGRGFYYEPTVLTGLAPDAPILAQEIFGPVAPVVPFLDVDHAVQLANDTEYGLISYVYGGDLGSTLAVAERMDSGMVGVNRALVSDPAAPFGGTKQSGLGREGGHEGMLAFTESRYIAADW